MDNHSKKSMEDILRDLFNKLEYKEYFKDNPDDLSELAKMLEDENWKSLSKISISGKEIQARIIDVNDQIKIVEGFIEMFPDDISLQIQRCALHIQYDFLFINSYYMYDYAKLTKEEWVKLGNLLLDISNTLKYTGHSFKGFKNESDLN